MKLLVCLSLVGAAVLASACGERDSQSARDEPSAETPAPESATGTARTTGDAAEAAPVEIVPGLSRRILERGDGPIAQPGQAAVVHYTGWLHDESAPDKRGRKFDSSVDRGRPFEFRIGAGNVIRGWDQGVPGMAVGEVRELTIAPELAYGDRGFGDVIPANATLVFEVELIDLKSGN